MSRSALAVMAEAADLLTGCPDDDVAEEAARELAQAAADVGALVEAAKRAQVFMGMPGRIESRHRQALCDALARVI